MACASSGWRPSRCRTRRSSALISALCNLVTFHYGEETGGSLFKLKAHMSSSLTPKLLESSIPRSLSETVSNSMVGLEFDLTV